jgi:hypothetical protein
MMKPAHPHSARALTADVAYVIDGLKAEIRNAALRYVDGATPDEFESRWPRLCSAALISLTRAACAELRAFTNAGGLLLSDN